MRKFELILYRTDNPEEIRKARFTLLPVVFSIFVVLLIFASVIFLQFRIFNIKKEIKKIAEYEPEFYVSRADMMPFINSLNSAIVKVNDLDVFTEEVFEVPSIQYTYDFNLLMGNYTKASRLFNLLHSDDNPFVVNILHLRRFSALLNNELEKRFSDNLEILHLLEEQNIIFAHTPSIWPTNDRLTSGFGFRRSPFSGLPTFHEGTDMGAPVGTPIRSSADGIVVFAGTRTGYGYLVTVDHGFGYMTRYAHASALLVKPGDFVKKGDIIALVGATGRSAGSHLHYEVLYNGTPVNSGKFLPNEGRKN